MNTPPARQQWIYETLIQEPLLGYEECWPKYALIYPVSKSTFKTDWKKAKQQHTDYQQRENEAKDKAAIDQAVTAVKQGLKTKKDRLLSLQEIADGLNTILTTGKVEDGGDNEDGTPKMRKIDVYERVALSKAYKDVQAEISKIEGDYAPKKMDLDPKGKGVAGFIIQPK
jgi:hypothetical protein